MILLPRPAPHLPRTVQMFQEAGLTDLLPLALSHPEPVPTVLPESATAIILTSPLAARSGLDHLPVYCVGKDTANAARQYGCTTFYFGTKNSADLGQELTILPTQHFIHLHGDYALLDWHQTLCNAGHTVTPLLAYHTHRITTLPEGLTQPTFTCLFSAGTATHLANLMKHANMQPSGTAIALSPAVAAAAAPHWSRVITAPQPTLASMVATIASLQG